MKNKYKYNYKPKFKNVSPYKTIPFPSNRKKKNRGLIRILRKSDN